MYEKEKLLKALGEFCSEGAYLEEMQHPFLYGGNLCATNGFFLMCMNAAVLGINTSGVPEGHKLKVDAVIPEFKHSGCIRTADLAAALDGLIESKNSYFLLGNTPVTISNAYSLLVALRMCGADAAAYSANELKKAVSFRIYYHSALAVEIVVMPYLAGAEDTKLGEVSVVDNVDCGIDAIAAELGLEQVLAAKQAAIEAETKAKRYVFLVPFVKTSYVAVYAKNEDEAREIADTHGDPDDWDADWELDDTNCPEVYDAEDVRDMDGQKDGVCTKDGFISWEEFDELETEEE